MPKRIPSHRPPLADTARADYESRRGRLADKRFYASAAWTSLRRSKLAEQPLCADCLKLGVVKAAAHVHHTLARKQRPDLALDFANLESLCASCHNARAER